MPPRKFSFELKLKTDHAWMLPEDCRQAEDWTLCLIRVRGGGERRARRRGKDCWVSIRTSCRFTGSAMSSRPPCPQTSSSESLTFPAPPRGRPPSRGGPPLVAHGGDALALGALGAVRLHLAVALRVEVARAGLALLRRARLEGEDDRRGAVVPAGLAHVAARRAVLGGRTRTRQLARSAGGRLGDGGRTRQSSVMCLV